jgi:uncharacterized protein involved in oxidation of intracellular sulfur
VTSAPATLRLAGSFAKRDGVHLRCRRRGGSFGYHHLDRMITTAGRHGTEIGCCATCRDARAVTDDQLITPAHRATLEDLADWLPWADKTATS